MNEKKNLNMNENGAMSHRITLSMVECEVAGLPRRRVEMEVGGIETQDGGVCSAVVMWWPLS